VTDWVAVTQRNARSVQTTIGWIFWDPGAVARYEQLGLPGPLGYIASRAAPLGPAGPDATIAAFGSISPVGIRMAFDLVAQHSSFADLWDARNAAVVDGLHEHAPAIIEPLSALGPQLWPIVEELPAVGRVFFAAHLRMPRAQDPLLSGWHAVNCLREWRGDLHWALVAAAGLDGVEASILHNAWLGYERDWLPVSRGTDAAALGRAWNSLEQRGLVQDDEVTAEGIALRQRLEDETDRFSTRPWQQLGEERARQFAVDFEPPCEALLRRVDVTAGPNYQPASRVR
jgi:hypothetical protein